MGRLTAFGVLVLYVFFMVIARSDVRTGKASGQHRRGSARLGLLLRMVHHPFSRQLEQAWDVDLTPILGEARVLGRRLFLPQRSRLDEDGRSRVMETSSFDEKLIDRPKVWPSMSDNFAAFFVHVSGPRLFLIFMLMLPSAMLLNMAQYGQVWFNHAAQSLRSPMTASSYGEDSAHIELGDVVFHPRASCEYLHFVPMPYVYNIAKVVIVSLVQDILFGSGNLHKTKDDRFKFQQYFFSVYTVCCVVFAWCGGLIRSRDEVFGTSIWETYEGILYGVNMQSGVSSLMLLTIKMFCEINVNRLGAPPGLGRLLSGSHWKAPGLETDREKLFWVGVIVLSVGFLPLALTHILPMTAAFALGVIFPLWSPLVVLCGGALYSIRGDIDPSVWVDVLRTGAGVHCRTWQSMAVIGFMTLAGVLLRKWLWELHALAVASCWFGGFSGPSSGSTHYADDCQSDQESSSEDKVVDDDEQEDDSVTQPLCHCTSGNPRPRPGGSDGSEFFHEPHGPYGFNLACYQVLFTLPLLAYCNSMISAGVAIYSGSRPVEDVFMADFTSRRILPFNQCLVSSLVPLRARILSMMSLL
eukprot:CAMPEP_0206470218 /NCGR_PEP_ID=MMETSP0324_2-20121206/30788_1 /ASSEMBLY_ACC=CAM_ASM_000836 /TAXON_ID=2866 /ORGANISM="Crypthecodinium cohnii, Strain Seligo" /LENGTH=581 /DNA_ID=CAMNT_0053944213 /DNA_START=36 /DNA_END=1782 /DNA_ORIENTATION=+